MATFSDTFNRADLGDDWVTLSGTWTITDNQLNPGADTGTVILRAATAMDSADHSAQVTIATPADVSMGLWIRGDAAFTAAYLWRNDGVDWQLFSFADTTFSPLGSSPGAAAPGDVAKVQAVGTTITGYVNGEPLVSVTNSTVTTGSYTGLRSGTPGTLRYDDYTAADVVTGAALGTAAQTAAAQTVSGTKTATLGTAATTTAAQTVSGTKTAALGTAATTDTARPLTDASTGHAAGPDTTYTVGADDRTYTIGADDRTYTIGGRP